MTGRGRDGGSRGEAAGARQGHGEGTTRARTVGPRRGHDEGTARASTAGTRRGHDEGTAYGVVAAVASRRGRGRSERGGVAGSRRCRGVAAAIYGGDDATVRE
jgi:hypothetical protein